MKLSAGSLTLPCTYLGNLGGTMDISLAQHQNLFRTAGHDQQAECRMVVSDLDLVRDALAKKDGASEALLQRLRCLARFLEAINLRAGKPLDSHEVADVVQDALLVVWRKLDQFTGPDGLDSWALRIVRFEFQNARRKKARIAIGTVSIEEAPEIPLPGDSANQFLERGSLAGALDQLPTEAAETIRLRHYGGLTFDEIAERMGCASGTAKTRYYRGLTRLAESLESFRS